MSASDALRAWRRNIRGMLSGQLNRMSCKNRFVVSVAPGAVVPLHKLINEIGPPSKFSGAIGRICDHNRRQQNNSIKRDSVSGRSSLSRCK